MGKVWCPNIWYHDTNQITTEHNGYVLLIVNFSYCKLMFYWMSFCWLTFYWLSLCWIAFCQMPFYWMSFYRLSFLPNVIAECHSHETYSAECHSSDCHFPDTYSNECHSAECHYAESSCAECHLKFCTLVSFLIVGHHLLYVYCMYVCRCIYTSTYIQLYKL